VRAANLKLLIGILQVVSVPVFISIFSGTLTTGIFVCLTQTSS